MAGVVMLVDMTVGMGLVVLVIREVVMEVILPMHQLRSSSVMTPVGILVTTQESTYQICRPILLLKN